MKKLVCTITSHVYEPMRAIVYPMLKRYAHRVGADFAAIEDLIHVEDPVLDKFRVADFLDHYDRLIYFDSDMVVRGDCPNLFELVPEHMLAAYEESSSFDQYKEGKQFNYGPMGERVACMIDLCIAWKLKIPVELLGDLDKLKYFNMGTYVCSKQHQYLFRPQEGETFTHPVGVGMPEQCYMNWGFMIHKVPIYHLPACFNQMPHNLPLYYQDCSFVIHYAGNKTIAERLAKMQSTIDYWTKVGLNGS